MERAVEVETDPERTANYTKVLAGDRKMADHERVLRGPDFNLEVLIEQEERYRPAAGRKPGRCFTR